MFKSGENDNGQNFNLINLFFLGKEWQRRRMTEGITISILLTFIITEESITLNLQLNLIKSNKL